MKKFIYILLIPLTIFSQATYQKSKYDQVWYSADKEKSHSTFTEFDTSSFKIKYSSTGKPMIEVYDELGNRIFFIDSLDVTYASNLSIGTFLYSGANFADSLRGLGFTKDVDEWFDSSGILSAGIKDGVIVNADVNTTAAIEGTKISPDFGALDITSTGKLYIEDSIRTNGALTVKGETRLGLTATPVIISTSGKITATDSIISAGFRTTGNTYSATYGNDKSITDAELLTLDNGAITEILVGGGVGLAPVWTLATGTGSPVRAAAPTLTGQVSINTSGSTKGLVIGGNKTTVNLLEVTNDNDGVVGDSSILVNSKGWMVIGGATAMNPLDIEGGMVIGSDYAGSLTAPTNGLAVQGVVLIGDGAVTGNCGMLSVARDMLNQETAQLTLVSSTDNSNKMFLGYNTSLNAGWISASTEGISDRPLLIGNDQSVYIGSTTSADGKLYSGIVTANDSLSIGTGGVYFRNVYLSDVGDSLSFVFYNNKKSRTDTLIFDYTADADNGEAFARWGGLLVNDSLSVGNGNIWIRNLYWSAVDSAFGLVLSNPSTGKIDTVLLVIKNSL